MSFLPTNPGTPINEVLSVMPLADADEEGRIEYDFRDDAYTPVRVLIQTTWFGSEIAEKKSDDQSDKVQTLSSIPMKVTSMGIEPMSQEEMEHYTSIERALPFNGERLTKEGDEIREELVTVAAYEYVRQTVDNPFNDSVKSIDFAPGSILSKAEAHPTTPEIPREVVLIEQKKEDA